MNAGHLELFFFFGFQASTLHETILILKAMLWYLMILLNLLRYDTIRFDSIRFGILWLICDPFLFRICCISVLDTSYHHLSFFNDNPFRIVAEIHFSRCLINRRIDPNRPIITPLVVCVVSKVYKGN